MRELLDNNTCRLKPENNYLNGFSLFKEIAGMIMQYFKYVNMYEGFKGKENKYENKFQFIELSVSILEKLLTGNYINFSM